MGSCSAPFAKTISNERQERVGKRQSDAAAASPLHHFAVDIPQGASRSIGGFGLGDFFRHGLGFGLLDRFDRLG